MKKSLPVPSLCPCCGEQLTKAKRTIETIGKRPSPRGFTTFERAIFVCRKCEVATVLHRLPQDFLADQDIVLHSSTAYPEHKKLTEVKEQSQACGEFLEWLLGSRGYTLGEYHVHNKACNGTRMCDTSTEFLFPAPHHVQKLLAEFFDVDMNKLEDEKRAMLEFLR